MKKLISTLTQFVKKNQKSAFVAGSVLLVVAILSHLFLDEDGNVVGAEE